MTAIIIINTKLLDDSYSVAIASSTKDYNSDSKSSSEIKINPAKSVQWYDAQDNYSVVLAS